MTSGQYWRFAAAYGSGQYGACSYSEGSAQQENCSVGAPNTGEGGMAPAGPPGLDYWLIVGLTLIAIAGFIVAFTRVFRGIAARKRQRAATKAE